ncbi:MAG: FAD-dependent oxidoreductase, partial [Kiloniellales bacterium]|nr:FAD-dependent oxidoreductase [Kiloniellales bacterium]
VVGGGPAGLEVARVAAERGHKVALSERAGELGGQFRLAAGQPQRGEIGELLTYYQRQLEKLQVQVMLRKEMGAGDIEGFDADVIVVATGSQPSRDGFQTALPHVDVLPGVEQDNVCTVHDVLEGDVIPGTNVLLLDGINGWWPASGTALHLALQRHWVTLVTSAEQPAAALNSSRTGSETRAKFIEFGVEALPSTVLLRWQGNTATLMNLFTEEVEERAFDSLVLATPSKPDNRLGKALAGSGAEVHVIGDAVAARTASMAFFEARRLGLLL